MVRVPGWIFGVSLTVAIAACGAGDQSAAEDTDDAAATPPAQPEPGPPAAPQAQAQAEPEPESEPQPPATVTGRLYTVQVGAFVTPDSARIWSDRLARGGLPVWTTRAVVDGKVFHRLRIGALPSLTEAQRFGQRITREYDWPVWVAPVEDNAELPSNVIARTSELVRGS